jgi:hypothetical protein
MKVLWHHVMMFHSRKATFTIVIYIFIKEKHNLFPCMHSNKICVLKNGANLALLKSLNIECTFRLSLLGGKNWNIGLVFVEFFCCIVDLKSFKVVLLVAQ